MTKSYIREKLQSFVHNVHKTFFYAHYKQVTELLVPNLFKTEKIRLGRVGDGTYILPEGLVDSKNYLLALGIADDISFEEDFIKLYPDTTVLAFDPSIAELPAKNDKIKFESKGVAGFTSTEKNMISLADVIKTNNIKPTDQIIIKMDIEGWEWGIFDNLNLDNYNIPVIVIEFHMMQFNTISQWLFFPYHFWNRLNILRKILKRFYIFHMHANNYGYTYFKNFTFPWLFEMTLVKKELFFDDIHRDVAKFNTINCNDRPDVQFPFFK